MAEVDIFGWRGNIGMVGRRFVETRWFVKYLWMLILILVPFLLVAAACLEAKNGHRLTDPKTGIIYNCLGDSCYEIGRAR